MGGAEDRRREGREAEEAEEVMMGVDVVMALNL